MNVFIIDNEIFLRLGFFFAIFISMAIWEEPAKIQTEDIPNATRNMNQRQEPDGHPPYYIYNERCHIKIYANVSSAIVVAILVVLLT